jgi:hypothetical protein
MSGQAQQQPSQQPKPGSGNHDASSQELRDKVKEKNHQSETRPR